MSEIEQLNESTFKTIVASTPLISMDLIVKNSQNQILLGLRNNQPAQSFWFVPGGRIYKDETFETAFLRLTEAELGQAIKLSEAKFMAPFEHFYTNNVFNSYFSTHYVVLAYQIDLDISLAELPLDQHQRYKWWNINELLDSKHVHSNTKAYFSNNY